MNYINNKKGQGISLNVIIIAAIALVVLVVLIIVFTGKIGSFTTESETCATKGGQCVDACEGALAREIKGVCDEDSDGEPDDDVICCLRVGQQ